MSRCRFLWQKDQVQALGALYRMRRGYTYDNNACDHIDIIYIYTCAHLYLIKYRHGLDCLYQKSYTQWLSTRLHWKHRQDSESDAGSSDLELHTQPAPFNSQRRAEQFYEKEKQEQDAKEVAWSINVCLFKGSSFMNSIASTDTPSRILGGNGGGFEKWGSCGFNCQQGQCRVELYIIYIVNPPSLQINTALNIFISIIITWQDRRPLTASLAVIDAQLERRAESLCRQFSKENDADVVKALKACIYVRI